MPLLPSTIAMAPFDNLGKDTNISARRPPAWIKSLGIMLVTAKRRLVYHNRGAHSAESGWAWKVTA